MKKIFLLLMIFVCFTKVVAQSNLSDGNTPIIVPDPPIKKDSSCKILSFSLPCCIDKKTDISSIAIVTFDKYPCKITYNPSVVAPSGFVTSSIEKVTASAGGASFTASITAVNTNKNVGVTPLSFNFANLGKTLDKAIEIALGGSSPISPCKPKGSLIPKGNLGFTTSSLCCPLVPCVKTSYKYSGAASWSYGLNCHFPVAGCPYVASLDAVVSASLSGGFNINYQTMCKGGRACAGLNMKLSVGGGVGATLLAGFISADLQLVISGGASGQICFYPLPVTACGSINLGQVSIVGSVSAMWGLTSHSVDYVVYDGWNSPQFCF